LRKGPPVGQCDGARLADRTLVRVVLLVLFVVACVEDAETGSIEQHGVELKWFPIEPRESQLDLLFVLDTDATTQAHRARIVANGESFVNVLRTIPGGLPLMHLGVVTIDGRWRAIADPRIAGEPVLDTALDDLGPWLAEALDAPAWEGPPRLFDVVRDGLARHSGFRRPGSYLHIVFITARDDASPVAVDDMLAYLKADGRDRTIITAISGTRGVGCELDGDLAAPAPRLHALVAGMPSRATFTVLCQSNLSDALSQYVGPLRPFASDPCWQARIDPSSCTVEFAPRDAPAYALPACRPIEDVIPRRSCWRHVVDPSNCTGPDHLALALQWDQFQVSGVLTAQCAVRR